MIAQIDVRHAAQGHWPRILLSLGLPPEALRNQHQPCPCCGGTDRFRFDDKDGRGTYYCNQCGAGDGFDLAMKYQGWDFKRCADEVRQVLGIAKRKELWEAREKAKAEEESGSTCATLEVTGRGNEGFATETAKASGQSKAPTRDYALSLWRDYPSLESWDTAVASHTYAIRKRIEHAAGARRGRVTGRLVGQSADCLLIPQRTLEGELIGVECINPEGVKQTFGNKGILILGNDLDVTVPMLVVEGWASAVKWLDSRRWNACCVVSFGKGSAEKAALALQSHYPNHFVLVGVEHD